MRNKKEKFTWKVLMEFIPFLKPHIFWVIVTAICAVFLAGINIANSYVIKELTDKATYGEYDGFINTIYLAIAVATINIIISFINTNASERFKTYFTRDIRNYMTSYIQKLPGSFFEKYHTGDIVSRLNNNVSSIIGLINSIINILYQPLLFIGAVIFIYTINWKLMVCVVILFPFSAPLYNQISKPIQKYSKALEEENAKGNALCTDTINGIYILKAYNLQKSFCKKYNLIINNVMKKYLSIDKVNCVLFFVMQILRYLPMLVCPVYGGYLTYHGEMSVGGLLAASTMLWYTAGPVEAILGLIRQMREVMPAAERVLEVLNTTPERKSGRKFKLNKNKVAVEFKNVSFGYDKNLSVLKNLNFKINKGESVALVGKSGCGKSTILKLLTGFYEPQKGQIKIFSNNLNETKLKSIRSQFSLVTQDSSLFSGTIGENISYGKKNATFDEVIAAAKLANAHDFILKMPEGYNTHIGENGDKLSGGQKQRIAIARAILKNARVMLLDEPTSALDAQSEASIQETLNNLTGKHTTIMITHRLSSIENFDKIMVLDKGKIVETGTHKELLAIKGEYYNLYYKKYSNDEQQSMGAIRKGYLI